MLRWILVPVLVLALVPAVAMAKATVTNSDSSSYNLRIATSDSCFSGTDTSIGGNTTSSFDAGWLCLNRSKPGVKIDDGKAYVIKDGKVRAK